MTLLCLPPRLAWITLHIPASSQPLGSCLSQQAMSEAELLGCRGRMVLSERCLMDLWSCWSSKPCHFHQSFLTISVSSPSGSAWAFPSPYRAQTTQRCGGAGSLPGTIGKGADGVLERGRALLLRQAPFLSLRWATSLYSDLFLS